MYHSTNNNYLTQPAIQAPSSSSSQSPNIRSSQPSSNSSKQHAFESDHDHDDSESDEDDSTGFQVYKDNASQPHYGNLPVSPTSPTFPNPSNTSQTPLNKAPNPGSNRNRSTLITPNSTSYPPDHPNVPNARPSAHQAQNPELVHMPALGSDWDKDESKRDKDWEGKDNFINKDKWNKRKDQMLTHKSHVDHQFRDFLAGRRKLAGWFTRFMALGFLIICLILGVLLAFFLVPRAPILAYDNETALMGDSSNGLSFQTQEPVKFNFNGNMNLAMLARSSYVKPNISPLTVTIADLSSTSSTVIVGSGKLNHNLAVSTKDYTPFSVDLKFSYSASSSKDPVWTAWHEACGHKWPGKTDRPTLQLGIIVEYGIVGSTGTHSERTILNNVTCPVELPANAA